MGQPTHNHRRTTWKWASWAAVLIAFLSVAVLVLWVVPAWLTQKPHVAAAERLKAIADARTGFAAFLAGVAAAAGLGYTARAYRLSRTGQVTDRFAKAVELLRDQQLPYVRVGAVYALESVARDSPRDAPAIVDVLAAFVRVQSPWPDELKNRDPERSTKTQDLEPLKNRAPDVQAALSVLVREPLCRTRVAACPELPTIGNLLDLSRTDLRLADLAHAQLQCADLHFAQLDGANLTEAHLERSDLRNASFGIAGRGHKEGADFTNVYLYGADLRFSQGLDIAHNRKTARIDKYTRLPS